MAHVSGYLERLMRGDNLSREETRRLFENIMSGRIDPAPLAALLTAWAIKGESIDELTGAAEVLREKLVRVPAPPEAIDTCGTGGDGISTFNISTAAAIVAAGAGAIVAKHGNHTNTRASGSAEVMAALGIALEVPVETLAACLREIRLAFLYAPALHPAMRFAAPVRRALGVRTIFNLLGPLANPAGVRRQVLGVSRRELVPRMAQVLVRLGAEHAWVVHGSDGLCDLTVTGPSWVAEVRAGHWHEFQVAPEQVGLSAAPLESLLVGSAGESAEAIRQILAGAPGPRRDAALLNAAAALVVAGLAPTLTDGVDLARSAIDTGAAAATLDALRARCPASNHKA